MRTDDKPLVAIYCLVYNHEPYLRDCFEGFVMQKTNFRFVAVVHEDVSTDKSAAIIREYADKYPEIFRPIYETENQYSKQDGSLYRIMNAAIDTTGAKYIAMCEGDDYWTDPYKLQKQIDWLESHSDCSMCVHAAMWEIGEEKLPQGCQYKKDCDLSTEEIIENGGLYIAMASTIYRKDSFLVGDKRPSWWKMADVGDYPLHIYAALIGKVRFMPEPMCVYRFQHPGSWTYNQKKIRDIMHIKCEIAWMELLDKETNYNYSDAIYNHLLNFYYLLYDERELSTRECYNKVSRSKKFSRTKFIKKLLKRTFRSLYKVYYMIKYRNIN